MLTTHFNVKPVVTRGPGGTSPKMSHDSDVPARSKFVEAEKYKKDRPNAHPPPPPRPEILLSITQNCKVAQLFHFRLYWSVSNLTLSP